MWYDAYTFVLLVFIVSGLGFWVGLILLRKDSILYKNHILSAIMWKSMLLKIIKKDISLTQEEIIILKAVAYCLLNKQIITEQTIVNFINNLENHYYDKR